MKSPSAILFLAASLWGLYWVPLREIESLGLTTTWSVAFFNAGPLVVLIPYVLWRRATHFQHLRAVAIIGLFTGLGLSFYASGLVFSSVIRVTLLFYLTPIWSTIIGVVWLSEKLRPGRIVAIVLGLGGLWLLLAANDDAVQPLNVGDLMALLSGIFWGFGAAGMKKWPEAPTAMTAIGQFVTTTVFCTFLALAAFGDTVPDGSVFLAALPVAFLASVLVLLPSLFAIFWASRLVYPGRVGILMMSEAIVAIISASLLLPEESMTFWQWVGGVVILTACLVEVFAGDKDPDKDRA
jgi:drug/metabolite transporter (DMT)-like permease